jgi:hypothetical protein
MQKKGTKRRACRQFGEDKPDSPMLSGSESHGLSSSTLSRVCIGSPRSFERVSDSLWGAEWRLLAIVASKKKARSPSYVLTSRVIEAYIKNPA